MYLTCFNYVVLCCNLLMHTLNDLIFSVNMLQMYLYVRVLTKGRILLGEGPSGLPLKGNPKGVHITTRKLTAKQEARNIKKDFILLHK